MSVHLIKGMFPQKWRFSRFTMMTMKNDVLFRRLDSALKKRKFRIKPKDRIVARISKQTYRFICAYSMKHEIYIEVYADEILRIGIQKVHFPKDIPKRTSINDSAHLLNGKASYY